MEIFTRRKENTHKGSYGRVGIIGGSLGMTGSVYLSAEAGLRTGSGLVYLLAPKSLVYIISIKLIEGIVYPIEDLGRGHFLEASLEDIREKIKNLDALALGPGMGIDEARIFLTGKILESFTGPMVIDADGINCLARQKEILLRDKRNIILTPHPGEMARLINKDIDFVENNREKVARNLASKYGLIVVLKGANTIVTSGDRVYVNESGNPGMATAGSGDVLTGIILSLLGQGMGLFDSAKLGVYLHGVAGDLARNDKGEYGMLARDIVENIPYGIKQISREKA